MKKNTLLMFVEINCGKKKKERNIDKYTNKLVGEPCFIHTGMSCEAASKYIFIYVTWTRV